MIKVQTPGPGPSIQGPRGYPGGPITGPQEGQTTVAPANPALPVSPDNIATLTPRTVPGLGDLWSLPDGTRDTYDGRAGELVQRVGKIMLDGTEAWESWTSGGHTVYAIEITPQSVPQSAVYQTHFRHVDSPVWAIGMGEINQFANYCVDYDDGAGGVDAFKTWLAAQKAAGTPVTILYALAQPTTQYILTTAPIPTQSTDLGAPSWTGKSTLSGDPAPERPAAIAGVPFAATATGGGQTRTVDLGFTGYSLPDGTCDTYDGRTGELVQRVGRLVLDGTEGWYPSGNNNSADYKSNNFYPYAYAAKVPNDPMHPNVICTHFATATYYDIRDTAQYAVTVWTPSTGEIRFTAPKTGTPLFNSVDSVKTWLAAQAAAGTPVTVLYELNTPIRTTRKADLQCFDGETAITGADRVEIIDGRVERVGGYLPGELATAAETYPICPNYIDDPKQIPNGAFRYKVRAANAPSVNAGTAYALTWDSNFQTLMSVDEDGDLYIAAKSGVPGQWKPWRKWAVAAPPQEFDLPLAEGFTAVSAATHGNTYSKDQFGRCFVTGFISGAFTPNVVIATLPPGFRPSKEVHAPCYFSGANEATGASGRVSINPQGQIFCFVQGDANKNALFNFWFLAE